MGDGVEVRFDRGIDKRRFGMAKKYR